jgi:hypothetical protein
MSFPLPRRTGLALVLFCVTLPAIAQTQEGSSVSIPVWLPTTCATLFVGFLVWLFNQWSIRRSARQDHIRMLLDIDKQLIEKPELWLIYDDYPAPAGRQQDPWDPARREAFIYFHLNMFEAVFDFHRWLAPTWEVDKEYEKSWKHYVKDFFDRSSEARRVWEIQRTRTLYSTGFVSFIQDARSG